ncbi:hypothetical protein ACSVBT_10875 [Afipia sp. TerB]
MKAAVVRIGSAIAMVLSAGYGFSASADDVRDLQIEPSHVHRQFTLGQRPFAADSSWNTPIAANAVYQKIGWPAAARFSVAWSSYSPAIYVASDSDPVVSIEYPAGWGYPGGILNTRMPPNADGAPGTDGELLVIDGDTVHNFWQFKRLGPTEATARSYGSTNVVTGSGWGRASPFLGAGIVATGSSQLAGLLVQAETDLGEIRHALQIVIEMSLAKPGRTGDAISGDGKNPDGLVQEGQRLAIPATAPMPLGLSPLGQQVFRAYQKYGAFVVDVAGGVTNLRAQANAYDRATIIALQRDVVRITPMLQRVEQAGD